MGKTPILFDALGNEIRIETPPPADHQAEVGRVRDYWASRVSGEITPELAARVMRPDAELWLQMAVAKRLLNDPHIFTCMRNLAYGVSRLPWTVNPFDEKSAASKKQAEEMRSFYAGLRWFKKLFRYLIFGEFYPFSAAGLQWNRDYMLDGYVRINPVRWRWDIQSNSLRLEVQSQGGGLTLQPINRRGYIIYEAELEPGGVRERGLWRKVLWLWMFMNFSWAAWVRFAEAYGNPYIWAFFSRPEDKESVLEGVLALDANARGVFPEGTDIKLQEASRYSTNALYNAIIDAAQAGITKVILGHQLNTDAKSGTGTLAGKAAADVSQENKEGVADNLEETIQEDIGTPFATWHYGEDVVARNEFGVFKIDSTPPTDQLQRSTVFINLNTALAPAGETIDPEQIRHEGGVRTVPLVRQPAPVDPQQQQRRSRRVAQAAGTRIATLDDVNTFSQKLVKRAAEDFSQRISEIFAAAPSIEEGADALVESYAQLQTIALASGLRDAAVLAEVTGRGDAHQ